MPISIQCGQCGKRYAAPDALAGKQVKCKNCGAAIAVPGAGAAPAPAPAPKPPAAPPPQRSAPAAGGYPPAPAAPYGQMGMPPVGPGMPGYGGYAPAGYPPQGYAPGGYPQPGMPGMGGMPMYGQPPLGGMAGNPNPYASPTAYGSPSFARPARGISPLTPPAIGLIAAGVLNLIVHLVWAGYALMMTPPGPPPDARPEATEAYELGVLVGKGGFVGCLGVVGLPINILMLVGGVKMLNRTSAGMARTGAILALIPCSYAWPINLGLGIWALVMISKYGGRFG